jgi:hypothetical protein
MDGALHDQLNAAFASQPAQGWWYSFYFSPPALPAGSRGVDEVSTT